jgi:hypothetical protein
VLKPKIKGILVHENLPKRVAVLRNGMFITDQMSHLKRFGEYKEFVAVVECLSKKGNELLRDMDRRLTIARSSLGKVKQGVVKSIPAKQGSRVTVDLELNADFEGALKVIGHAV